jgi:hypothetical protein
MLALDNPCRVRRSKISRDDRSVIHNAFVGFRIIIGSFF